MSQHILISTYLKKMKKMLWNLHSSRFGQYFGQRQMYKSLVDFDLLENIQNDCISNTATTPKVKFFIKDFFGKRDHTIKRPFPQIFRH